MAAKGQTLAEFEPLHPAERKLLVACRDGEAAVIANSRPEKLTPDNHVRADFIRFLARGGDGDAPVHEAGINLCGGVVVGDLDLSRIRVPFSLELQHCLFQTEAGHSADFIARGATLEGGLILTGSQVNKIDGVGLCVHGGIYLDKGFSAGGTIWLLDARIEGVLQCSGGYFMPETGDALSFDRAKISGCVFLRDGFCTTGQVRFLGAEIGSLECGAGRFNPKKGRALVFDGATVLGGVFLDNGFHSTGEVRCIGGVIHGNLECDEGSFNIEAGEALNFDNSKVNGSIFLRNGLQVMGEVRLLGVIIEGNLDCTDAFFKSNTGGALVFERARINGSVFLRLGFHAEGDIHFASAEIGAWLDLSDANICGELNASRAVVQNEFNLTNLRQRLHKANLRHMQCGSLLDDSTSWGTGNHLNGFTYRSLAHEAPIEPGFRVKWLQAQSPESGTYRPQPWRHLQKTLKAMGHDAEARAIGIAHEKERRRRKVIGQARGNGWFQHLTAQLTGKLHDLYGFFTAYGYEPVRLLYAMLFVWLFCALVYWGAALGGMMGPTSPLVFQNEKYSACMAEWRDWTPNIFVKRSDHNWYFCEKLPGDYTTFSPLMYSLDLLLPLVDLFQDKDWGVQIPTPRDNIFEEYAAAPSQYLVRLVVWLEILFGWMASLMLVAVISGMARNTRDDE